MNSTRQIEHRNGRQEHNHSSLVRWPNVRGDGSDVHGGGGITRVQGVLGVEAVRNLLEEPLPAGGLDRRAELGLAAVDGILAGQNAEHFRQSRVTLH